MRKHNHNCEAGQWTWSNVTLDEYDTMTCFLHISPIASGWIRNVACYVRPEQKAVLKVMRVNKVNGEVDTSLKQLSGEERKSRLIEVKKSDQANIFLDFIKSKLSLPDQQCQEIEDRILQNYDCVNDAFEAVSRKGLDAIQNIELAPKINNAKWDANKRIPIPVVEISVIMEITSKRPEGIEIINTLANADGNKGGAASTLITYIGAPHYEVAANAENNKVPERLMK